jgi:hypothetical protein
MPKKIETTTSRLQIVNLSNFEATGSLDAGYVLFDYLFTVEQTMKEKNKVLLLFLQDHVARNNVNLINRILLDNAFKDLHASLLKSALIMTEHLAGVEKGRQKISSILNDKLQA